MSKSNRLACWLVVMLALFAATGALFKSAVLSALIFGAGHLIAIAFDRYRMRALRRRSIAA